MVKTPIIILFFSLMTASCSLPNEDQDGRITFQKKYQQINVGDNYAAASNWLGIGICTTCQNPTYQVYDHFFEFDKRFDREIDLNTVYTSGVTLVVSNNIITHKAPIIRMYFK